MQEVSRDASVSMGDEPPAAGAAREIGDMSSDLLQKVLVTLTPEQVSNAAMVSRRWHTVGTCNDVWRRHCEAAWPSLVTQRFWRVSSSELRSGTAATITSSSGAGKNPFTQRKLLC